MTHLDDTDLIRQLQASFDDIPLPAGTLDDDVRRGRTRLHRARTLSASGVAAAVALAVGVTFLVTGTNRADEPIPPIDTPTPTPTTSTSVQTEPGPTKVAQLFDVGNGFIAREESGQIWYRDASGWEKRGRVQDFALTFAPNGQDGYGYEMATHDGGLTWTRYRSIGSACAPIPPAVTTRVVYLLPFATCENTWQGAATVQEFGSAEAHPVELPPYLEPGQLEQGPPNLTGVGEVLVGQFGPTGEATLAHILVSRDDGVTWDELPQPCPPASPASNADLGTDPDRQRLFAICPLNPGTTPFFELTGSDRWTQIAETTISTAEGNNWAAPVGVDTWLVGDLRRSELVTATGSSAVAFPKGLRAWGAAATVGTDIYVVAAKPSESEGAIYVSHDGGLTWQKEG